MKRIIYFGAIVCSILIASCTKVDDSPNGAGKAESTKTSDIVIDINTARSAGNILGAVAENGSGPATRAMGDDPFTEIRKVECFESVVLPELHPHIWIGNIMTKGSVANCTYKPLIYPREPITVSLTLPGTSPQEIENPTYSRFLAYIQEQTGNGTFLQNGEFSFSTEQFSSYNELKVAFGNNTNINNIFWGSSSSSSSTEHLINKATGLYIKFYQSSYKAIMDYPQGQIASIPANMIDSTVYLNSITFGRLGILALETNETAFDAKVHIENIFRTIFYSSSSTFTKEEQSFLSGCDFKVYLIGGNGNTSVESFSGLNGFIQHIKKGSFSRDQPGAPIFCTFNNVKDNSPLSINFKFSVKKEPVYVELIQRPVTILPRNKHYAGIMDKPGYLDNLSKIRGHGELFINFYRDRAKVKTIADPRIVFKVIEKKTERRYPKSGATKTTTTITETEVQNAGNDTFAGVSWKYIKGYGRGGSVTYDYNSIISMYTYQPPGSGRYSTTDAIECEYEYSIEDNDNFVVIGKPLNQNNTPLSRRDE